MILFLNSIGAAEIVVIFLFILIFFGADSIPGFARTFGKGIRQIKNASQDIQDEIMKTTSDMKRELGANRALEDVKKAIEKPMTDFKENLESTGHKISNTLQEKVQVPTQKKSQQNTGDKSVKASQTSSQSTDGKVFEAPKSPQPSKPLDQMDLD